MLNLRLKPLGMFITFYIWLLSFKNGFHVWKIVINIKGYEYTKYNVLNLRNRPFSLFYFDLNASSVKAVFDLPIKIVRYYVINVEIKKKTIMIFTSMFRICVLKILTISIIDDKISDYRIKRLMLVYDMVLNSPVSFSVNRLK